MSHEHCEPNQQRRHAESSFHATFLLSGIEEISEARHRGTHVLEYLSAALVDKVPETTRDPYTAALQILPGRTTPWA